MRIPIAVVSTIVLALVFACSAGYDGPSSPGGGGGGPVGSVSVGSGIQFVSRHNGTMNPAVDTIEVGGTVTWTWSGSLPHSVRSVGTPSFESSGVGTGSGSYAVTFPAPGSYRYDCSVHGQEMTGTVVVIGDAPGDRSATIGDAAGDTFGGEGLRWDVTRLTLSRAVTSGADAPAGTASPC